jgi:hypothetical protein
VNFKTARNWQSIARALQLVDYQLAGSILAALAVLATWNMGWMIAREQG